eukprot:gene34615-42700_t
MFPCLTSSSYAKSKNITCDSPEVQVEKTLQLFHENGIFIKHTSTFEHDINHSRQPVFVNRLYIDVEDEEPSTYYDVSPSVNVDFLRKMVAHLDKLKVPVGIYTKTNYWSTITANATGFNQYPLWYPRYDAVNTLDFFVPFGGWSTVAIKQTGGDVGWCGLSQ